MIPFFDKIASTFRWTEDTKNTLNHPKAPCQRRLRLEPLEDRTLLAVCYVWDNPNISGTGGNGNSWSTACKTLEAALEYAKESSRNITEIWVAEGTYTPSKLTNTDDQRSATFTLVDGVKIYGGFAGNETSLTARAKNSSGEYVHQTILSGDLGRNDNLGNSNTILENAYTVISGSGLSAAITIEGLTITGGNAHPYYSQLGAWPTDWVNGGGIFLSNCTNVTLANLNIARNNAQNNGGGVYIVGGATTIQGCTVIENFAGNSGGGISLGSVAAGGTLTVQSCVIADNSAGAFGGGGLFQANGTLHVSASHFSGNTGIWGGGLLQDANGTGTITNSSFISNVSPNRFSTQGQGGGICQLGVMDISWTTFANNVAGRGGGIFFSNNADNQNPKPESTYANLTISKNIAESLGGGFFIESGLLNLNASIVAANTAATSADIYGELAQSGGSKTTLVLSGSENVIGVGTGIPAVPVGSGKTTISNGTQGNLVGTATSPLDPRTGAPTDSGSGVFVLPLLANSPARDKSGAFNTTIATRSAQTYVVSSLEDIIDPNDGKLTFREAFEAANRNIQVGNAQAGSFTETDSIRFADGLTGTIYLNGKALTVYGGLTISGWTTSLSGDISSPGAMNYLTIDAEYKSSLVKAIGKVAVNISEITLQHGYSPANGGGMLAYSSNITLGKVAIRDCFSAGAEGGGGFYSKNATLVATDIVISDCSATVSGGGMFLNSTNASIVGASIYGNKARENGGGLFMTAVNGSSLISNATFAQNRASHGAGLAFLETTVRLVHLTVTKNVGDYIGGIMVGMDAAVVMDNSIAADNFSYRSPDIEVLQGGSLTGSNNLVGNNTGLSGGLSSATSLGNKIGTAASPIAPRFTGPTLYNGQMVYPLSSGSPAIDSGNNALSQGRGNATLTYDVRGSSYARLVTNTVDMGACEYQGNLSSNYVIYATNEDGEEQTTIRLGQSLIFTGRAKTGSIPQGMKFLWDLNNNGVFAEIGSWATQGRETEQVVTFLSDGIIPEPGLYPIRLIVEDSSGRRSDTYELGIIILVEAPTYTISGNTTLNVREADGWEIEAENTQNDPIMRWIVRWGDTMEDVINGGPRNRIMVRHLYAASGTYDVYVETTSFFGDVRVYKLTEFQVLAKPSADLPDAVFALSTPLMEELLPVAISVAIPTGTPQKASEQSATDVSLRFWEETDLETDDFPIEDAASDVAKLALYEQATDRIFADWANFDEMLLAEKKNGLFEF